LDRKVWLSWDNHGQVKQVTCKGLDISTSGMRVSSTEPLPTRDLVQFRIQGTAFAGTGSIRSCAHAKMKYLIGIEFGQGVRWDSARHPLSDPIPNDVYLAR
jgi:hypothetical protein